MWLAVNRSEELAAVHGAGRMSQLGASKIEAELLQRDILIAVDWNSGLIEAFSQK